MSTINELVVEIVESVIIKSINTWMIIEEEEQFTVEQKDIITTTTDEDEDDDDIIGDVVSKLLDEVCTVKDGGGDVATGQDDSLEETPGTTGQGDDVQAIDGSIGGREKEKDVAAAADIQKKKSTRGRTRRFLAAAWRHAKRMLLCGCCRRH